MGESSEEKFSFPKQGEWMDLVMGESWRGTLKINTIRYDFKPPSLDLSNAVVEHGADHSVTIKIPDADNSGNMTIVYTGHSYKPKKEAIISINRETGEAVLERIDCALRVKYTGPHNIVPTSEAPISGDGGEAPSDIRRPSSAMATAAEQPGTVAATVSVSAARVGTPSSTSGGKTKPSVACSQSDETQKQARIILLSDKEDSDEEDNMVVSSTSGGGGDGGGGGESGGSSGDNDEEGKPGVVDSKHEGVLPRLSPDCSSGASSKPPNTSTAKTQLSGSGSGSDLDEVAFDACSGSQPDRSSHNPSRASNSNGGSFSSVPEGGYTSNLSDSESDS